VEADEPVPTISALDLYVCSVDQAICQSWGTRL
jgi:hypothetical protein